MWAWLPQLIGLSPIRLENLGPHLISLGRTQPNHLSMASIGSTQNEGLIISTTCRMHYRSICIIMARGEDG